MQTSVAPSSRASFVRRTTSLMGRKYPSSSLYPLLKAQNPHRFMHTFVKLMFRLTTYVTTSPTVLLLSSSATATSRFISSPVQPNSFTPSATEMSWPSRALLSMELISGFTERKRRPSIDSNPVSGVINCPYHYRTRILRCRSGNR